MNIDALSKILLYNFFLRNNAVDSDKLFFQNNIPIISFIGSPYTSFQSATRVKNRHRITLHITVIPKDGHKQPYTLKIEDNWDAMMFHHVGMLIEETGTVSLPENHIDYAKGILPEFLETEFEYDPTANKDMLTTIAEATNGKAPFGLSPDSSAMSEYAVEYTDARGNVYIIPCVEIVRYFYAGGDGFNLFGRIISPKGLFGVINSFDADSDKGVCRIAFSSNVTTSEAATLVYFASDERLSAMFNALYIDYLPDGMLKAAIPALDKINISVRYIETGGKRYVTNILGSNMLELCRYKDVLREGAATKKKVRRKEKGESTHKWEKRVGSTDNTFDSEAAADAKLTLSRDAQRSLKRAAAQIYSGKLSGGIEITNQKSESDEEQKDGGSVSVDYTQSKMTTNNEKSSGGDAIKVTRGNDAEDVAKKGDDFVKDIKTMVSRFSDLGFVSWHRIFRLVRYKSSLAYSDLLMKVPRRYAVVSARKGDVGFFVLDAEPRFGSKIAALVVVGEFEMESIFEYAGSLAGNYMRTGDSWLTRRVGEPDMFGLELGKDCFEFKHGKSYEGLADRIVERVGMAAIIQVDD